MDQLVLIAPIGVAVVFGFFYLRRLGTPGSVQWGWAWLLLYSSGLLSVLERDHLLWGALGDGLSGLFGPFLLTGALAHVGRATPRWLLPLGLATAAARMAATVLLGLEGSWFVPISVEWPWLLVSTWVLGTAAFRRVGEPGERVLTVAIAGLAILWPIDAAARATGAPLLPLLAAWIALSVLAVIAQILVAFERVVARERQLRTDGERLARLVERTSDVIGIADPEGHMLYLNAAARRLFELPAFHALDGLRIVDLHPETEARRMMEEILPAARELGQWQGESILRTWSGRLVPVSAVLFSQFDESGAVRCFYASMRDLSERFAQEQEISDERRLIRTIIDTAPVSILFIDTDQCNRLINRTASEHFAIQEPQRWIGRPVLDCLREIVLPQVADLDALLRALAALYGESGDAEEPIDPDALLRRVLADRELEIRNFELQLAEPTRIFEVGSVPTLDGDGEFSGRVWIARDVTERRRLEQQVQYLHKLEAVGQLAGGIAHDFGNLLMAIGGFANLLQESVAEDPEAADFAASITSAVDSGQALIRQLLSFSRGRPGEPVVLELNELVRGTKMWLERLIGEDITLEVVLDRDAGRVRADASQLEQVMLNLVANARDAMPTGGTLRLETLSSWSPSPRQDGSGRRVARLVVSDTGVGMDAETQTRMFEPFFTTKPPGEGTGLGLATVFGIARDCGGELRVVSEPGHGTRVELDLPGVDEPVAEQGASRPLPAALPGVGSLLLVEDDPSVARVLRRALVDHGYHVLDASCAEEALEVAEFHAGQIAAVVSDVVMPGMSGFDLGQELRRRCPGIRVVLMSGYPQRTGMQADPMAGTHVLEKPFRPEELLRRLEDLLAAEQ